MRLTAGTGTATLAAMSIDQLTAEALALPLEEREVLAHALLDSIGDQEDFEIEPEYLKEILRRAEELDSGAVAELSHEEVMESARKALECD